MRDGTAAITTTKLRVQVPEALEVYLLGKFNNWSTTATPLIDCGAGEWEVEAPEVADPQALCLFVWDRGSWFGRIASLPG